MAQIFANGIFEASVILIVALGFALIYGTARFFHLAHGATYMVGAYTAYFFLSQNLPWFISVPLGILAGAAAGSMMEVFIYRHLRRYNAPSLIYLIASLGLLLVFECLFSLVFGNETRTIMVTEKVLPGVEVLGAIVGQGQLLIVGTSLIFSVLLLLFMRTEIGLTLRALAENSFLAKAMGIDVDRMILIAFAIGSACAGLAGVLVGMDRTIHPAMGFYGTLYAMLACVVGGLRSAWGTIAGSVLIGMAQAFTVAYLPSEWKDSVALGVLLIVLLIRPGGIAGTIER